MEPAQKLETGYAIESLRCRRDADNRNRLIEVELRNSDRNKVERKRTCVCASQLHMAHRDAGTSQAVVLQKDKLKDGPPGARAGVGHEPTNVVMSPTQQGQHDMDFGTVVLKGPSRSGHQTDLQISSTCS